MEAAFPVRIGMGASGQAELRAELSPRRAHSKATEEELILSCLSFALQLQGLPSHSSHDA